MFLMFLVISASLVVIETLLHTEINKIAGNHGNLPDSWYEVILTQLEINNKVTMVME